MNLKINNINNNRGVKNYYPFDKQVAFTGFGSALADVGKKLTKSSAHFCDYDIRKDHLNRLFGDEFTKMEDELRVLSSKVFDFNKRIIFDKNGGVTFVEDGILPKFIKSALYPFKDLWLDIACWSLEGLSNIKKIPAISDFASRVLKNNKVLANRANLLKAEEIFCIMQGAFSDLAKDEKTAQKIKNTLGRKISEVGMSADSAIVSDSQKTIVENLVHAASSIKGNYKTADERTFNRLCTGAVSSVMAGIDFYNISRMQNDNDELAKKSQNKRLKQEGSRILMSAGMTFLTLGALSKYANANKYIALFTITGTTLISEVLSRLLNGMPLHPLSPEEAKDFAYHKHEKEIKKQKHSSNQNINTDLPEVFSRFSTVSDTKKSDTVTQFKGKQKDKNGQDYSPLNLQNVLRAIGVFLVAGLTVCFARCRSEKFNSFLKNIRSGMDDAYDLLTKKDFWVPSKEVDKMFKNISDGYGLKDCAQEFTKALESEKYTRAVQNIDGKQVEMIKLGKIDRKIIAPLIKAITYPFGFLWGVVRFPVKILRTAFEKEASKDLSKVTSQDIMGLYKVYHKAESKLKAGDMNIDEFNNFIKRKVLLAAENKTGKSTYKNSSLAAISRPFVTLIASYFFVNDYRNEVLITSEGKDVEGANTVAKERVMHKVSNFFFNALLMNLFNSVFEAAYHGSLLGAGAVAAATEFTNENLIRKSIGVPTRKMTRAQIEEHDRQNLQRDDFWGKYFRFMSKITGKKTISQKVQDQEKKKAQKA